MALTGQQHCAHGLDFVMVPIFKTPPITPSFCAGSRQLSGTSPSPAEGLRASGHCPLPEPLSKQPLPFGVFRLEVVLPRLQCKELLIPLHVFSGDVEEDPSGAPEAGREEGGREVNFGLASARRRDALIYTPVGAIRYSGPWGSKAMLSWGLWVDLSWPLSWA